MSETAAAFLTRVLDELIEAHSQASGPDALVAARSEYDERRGRVFEDEELWEAWTQAFLEWDVVERVAPGGTLPPAGQALEAARSTEPERRLDALRGLLTSHRSLFEVMALRAGEVELLDILGGGRFVVAEQRVMHGVGTGDVIEVRLIGFEGAVYFGRTFCFHPSGTTRAIREHAARIRAAGGDRRDVIDFCASLRIRCERYRHVAPARIYAKGGAALDPATRAEP